MGVNGEKHPGIENRVCKGTLVGRNVVCFRNREKASVAEAHSMVKHGVAFDKSAGAIGAKQCHWETLRIFIGSDKI